MEQEKQKAHIAMWGKNPTKQSLHVLECPSYQVRVSGKESVTDLHIQCLKRKLPCNANRMNHLWCYKVHRTSPCSNCLLFFAAPVWAHEPPNSRSAGRAMK